MKKMWIAWEDDTSIRSKVLAEEIGAEYRAFTLFDRSRFLRWLRYPAATAQTVWALVRRRPDLVFVQNPSILLAFEAALLRPLLGFRLVIDLHTPFSAPKGIAKRIADALHGYGLRNCDGVVVTNEAFRARVARDTDRPVFILPDKVPELERASEPVPLDGALNVLYICTFSGDEPWREVVAAGTMVSDDVRIYVSGRSPLKQHEVARNVVLTGYLPRKDYQALLCSVDAVMVLTTAEENLVCGGYEAVAAGKPLILSDTAALKALFRFGTVYTRNGASDIAGAIEGLRGRLPEMARAIGVQDSTMRGEWAENWSRLLAHYDLEEEPADEAALGVA